MPQNIASSSSKQACFRRKSRHFSAKVSTPNAIAVNSSPAKSLLFPSEVPFSRPESSKKLSDKLRFFYFNCQHFATYLSRQSITDFHRVFFNLSLPRPEISDSQTIENTKCHFDNRQNPPSFENVSLFMYGRLRVNQPV